VNDYGIWRINRFGDFAAGDKTLVEKREQADRDAERLRTWYTFKFSAGLAYPLEVGPAFGVDVKFITGVTEGGLRVYTTGEDFLQVETFGGIAVPIRIKKVGLIPYVDVGLGFMSAPIPKRNGSGFSTWMEDTPDLTFHLSLQGGLQFTTSVVPGLYLQAAYQYNVMNDEFKAVFDPNLIFFSIGYGL
jgi:hypothetical protein